MNKSRERELAEEDQISIKCEDLVKVYNKGKPNECKALDGVSFEVKEGEFVAIVGHSGSGKSTLLHQISCLDTPTSGIVKIGGKLTKGLSGDGKAQLRRDKLGFVFQQFNLIKSLSALENITLPMEFAGKSKKVSEKRGRELFALVGLTGKEENLPTQLSGGQQQRVAIARALANNPQIIMADEPTGNLDSVTEKEILRILIELNRKEKKTLIIVTHEPSLAETADRVIKLKDGHVEFDRKGKGNAEKLLGVGSLKRITLHED